jgi:hypothetical protein
MKFFTEITIPESIHKIGYSTKLVMMGSCFAENIGGKLQCFKFNVDLNPFGILYNPASIVSSLQRLIDRQLMVSGDLFLDEGAWQSFSHHSRFASIDRDEALENMNSRIVAGHQNLAQARFLFVTFGSSWVYELVETGQIVSNCHKVEANRFRRFRLGVPQIVSLFVPLLKKLREFNPGLQVVFTVSPIRHWKDGTVENQLSKATLIVAIHEIIQQAGGSYFPSYEIVMDELRDYRFYSEDMIHLSDIAVNHIWGKFSETYLSEEAQKILKEVRKITEAASHKPFNSGSAEFKKFAGTCYNKASDLMLKYPGVDLSVEKEYFKSVKKSE